MERAESISLYFQAGSSDKRYDAFLEEANGGWVVNFAYGRRGSTLRPGTKTNAPVPYAQAKKIYDKLVGSKTAEGYVEGEGATAFQGGETAERISGLTPQLLNAIDSDTVSDFMTDDAWVAQPKHDGERRMVKLASGAATGINRKGLTVALSKSLEAAILALPRDCALDGEAIGDTLFVFDILAIEDNDLTQRSYKERLYHLDNVLDGTQHSLLVKIETALSYEQKQALYEAQLAANKEGLVFKRLDATYQPGRPASGGSQVKFKFIETASFLVSKVNAKRSVALALFDKDGAEIGVGNVTIPANHEIPAAGDIVEVQYLYAYKGGSVYQPVYLGKRADLDVGDCQITQLKYKAE